LQMMRETFPDSVTWTEPLGGYTLWVRLPERLSRAELDGLLQPFGVAVSAGQHYFAGASASEYFRLCISRTEEEEIRKGITRLGLALGRRFGAANRRPER
ncbi:MAG: aspartate aminotransferase, partial [Candidatus Aminicenantes bacterium]|nr:aspartate aminotransferase [Candidatus Aminicenantes bacterium]